MLYCSNNVDIHILEAIVRRKDSPDIVALMENDYKILCIE